MELHPGTDRARERSVRSFISHAPRATEMLGEALGKKLERETLILLDGELGAGKTCFVRGLARGLEVEDTITSPTYSLLQTYAGRLVLHHFDAWMEGRERAFLLDGGLETLHEGAIAVVEWGERIGDLLPRPRLCIRLDHLAEHERRIRLSIEELDQPAVELHRLVSEIEPIEGLEEIFG